MEEEGHSLCTLKKNLKWVWTWGEGYLDLTHAFIQNQCDKKFEHSYQLKAHKLGVHEGIWLNKKPINCKACGGIFKTANRYIKVKFFQWS